MRKSDRYTLLLRLVSICSNPRASSLPLAPKEHFSRDLEDVGEPPEHVQPLPPADPHRLAPRDVGHPQAPLRRPNAQQRLEPDPLSKERLLRPVRRVLVEIELLEQRAPVRPEHDHGVSIPCPKQQIDSPRENQIREA